MYEALSPTHFLFCCICFLPQELVERERIYKMSGCPHGFFLCNSIIKPAFANEVPAIEVAEYW